MNFLSLNVCGIRRDGKPGWVRSLKQNQGVDFLAVQESKLSDPSMLLLSKCWGNSQFHYDYVCSDGAAGGLISWWDPVCFKQLGVIRSKHVLIVSGMLVHSGVLLNIANVHAPNDPAARRTFWNDLLFFRRSFCGLWLFMGDFNDVISPEERLNSVFVPQNARAFNDFMRIAELYEYNMGGHKYTYMSGAGDKLSKLDRFLVCSEFLALWPCAKVTALPRLLSDHCPIVLSLKNTDFGRTPFRFFNSWLEIPGFESFVKNIADKFVFSGPSDLALAEKLKWLKGRMRLWINVERKKRDVKLLQARKKLEVLEVSADSRVLDASELESRAESKKIIFEEERLKAIDAKQKSRVKWAVDGDENSKYFHHIIRMNSASNRIHGISVDGSWVSDPFTVKNKIAEFFVEKFALKRLSKPLFDCPGIGRLSSEESSALDSEFSLEEITAAVWDCEGDKAPGPDGLNFAFIKKFWSLLKADFLKMFTDFYINGTVSEGCFSAFIALIPKGRDQATLSDYRPISLVGVLNKVLSKVLVLRLKNVLSRIISEEQTAFISDRNILDGPLILNETIAWMKRFKRKGLFLKVDIAKAYDSLRWDYLDDVMRQMNFSSKWRGWVMSIVRNSRASVLVNGSPTYEFSCECGLRQGDPLSPFLFIIAMEGLSCIMKRASLLGAFHGIRVADSGPLLSHFMYADDVVFCGEWSIFNALNLRRLLRGFFLVTGLKISSKKSCLYGVGVDDNEVSQLAMMIRCSPGRLPFNHLGVPIACNMNLVRNWNVVIEKFQKRLSRWKAKSLSYGGRITLLKSVLSSLPLYYFSIYRAPIQVVDSLERLRRIFFWGGTEDVDKMSWLAWEKVVAPIEYGGVGLGSLRDANLGLLSKWWYRFKENQGALWRKVVWSIHATGRGWNYMPMKASIGGTWKQIANIPSLLGRLNVDVQQIVKGKLKSGDTILFWHDVWLSDTSLANKYPALFALERNRLCYVADRLIQVNNSFQWVWDWRRNALDNSEQEQLAELLDELNGVVLQPGSDSWEWLTGTEVGFSVKGIKRSLFDASNQLPKTDFVWCNWVPKKVGIVAWRAYLDRLPTAEALARRHIMVESQVCRVCGLTVETVDHLFTGCAALAEVWQAVFDWCRVPQSFVFHVKDLVTLHLSAMSGNRQKKVFHGVILTTVWSIWRARNDLIFNAKQVSTRKIFEEIKVMSFLWITNRGRLSNMSWDSWGRFERLRIG